MVAEAENAGQTVDQVMHHRPDVLVFDVQMPSENGVEVIRRLRTLGSNAGILALVTDEDTPYIRAALDAGANGYVLKSSSADEIVEAVRAVHEANNVLIQGHLERRGRTEFLAVAPRRIG
jgi:NarL family two-component system response regulator LiaR